MNYLLLGLTLCAISIGLMVADKYPFVAGILLIVGVYFGVKGRNSIDG